MRNFLTVYAHGGSLAAMLAVIPPALPCGLALGFLLPREQPEVSAAQKIHTFFTARSPLSWVGRFALAILAFAVIYYFFGTLVAPFVVPFYRAGVLGLTLPPVSAVLPVLFARSTLFLLACLPFLIFWTRSRLSLIFSLGLTFWSLTGLYGMLMGLLASGDAHRTRSGNRRRRFRLRCRARPASFTAATRQHRTQFGTYRTHVSIVVPAYYSWPFPPPPP